MSNNRDEKLAQMKSRAIELIIEGMEKWENKTKAVLNEVNEFEASDEFKSMSNAAKMEYYAYQIVIISEISEKFHKLAGSKTIETLLSSKPDDESLSTKITEAKAAVSELSQLYETTLRTKNAPLEKKRDQGGYEADIESQFNESETPLERTRNATTTLHKIKEHVKSLKTAIHQKVDANTHKPGR